MLEGLPPNGAAHLLRLECAEKTARNIADIIVETFSPAETAAAAFEAEPSAENWTSDKWVVEVYFGFPPDEDEIRALIAIVAGQQAADQVQFLLVQEQDWVKSSLQGLAPVRAGRFVLHGSHDRNCVRTNDIALEIEAALAFGTGHHGTTLGCLRAMAEIARRRRPRHILDVGTGTGVLAIAAARLWRRHVACGDIDPVSTEAALANARLNHAHPFVRPVTARGARHRTLTSGAPYDLIFANILAKPLRLLAPELVSLAAGDAEFILSGLLARDVAGVLSAYTAQGFMLVQRRDIEGWATLILRRGGQSPRPQTSY